jgi:PadR family transcriptional regulator, regulatory protein PadR
MPLHGQALMTAIPSMSGEVLRAEEGSLYPALHRMEEAGGRAACMRESRWRAVTSAVNRVLRMA